MQTLEDFSAFKCHSRFGNLLSLTNEVID